MLHQLGPVTVVIRREEQWPFSRGWGLMVVRGHTRAKHSEKRQEDGCRG